jgi:pterin-4a-carbinolamine dehydratase
VAGAVERLNLQLLSYHDKVGETDEDRPEMRIFLSYRRKANVQRVMNIASIIRENLGKESVFLDTSDIESGSNFPQALLTELSQIDLVLAIISPEWLSSLDENYRRRIDSERDWVHIELRTALKDERTVIPVYVGGAKALKPDQLPESLKPLAELQSVELRDDHQWNDDVAALIGRIKGRTVPTNEVRWPKNLPKYIPDPVGPLKLQALIECLPGWQLHEFELEDGPFKGQRGIEIIRVFRFRQFLDAVDFMYQARENINGMDHHPRWENIFRDVVVRLSSWDLGHKITDRDYVLASYLNRLYAKYDRKLQSPPVSDPLPPE